MAINLKRGLGRVYLILSAVWILCVLIVGPLTYRNQNLKEIAKFEAQFRKNRLDDMRAYQGNPKEVEESMKRERVFADDYEDRLRKEGSLSSYYGSVFGIWWAGPLILLGPPILVYFILRVFVAIALWAFAGFRTDTGAKNA